MAKLVLALGGAAALLTFAVPAAAQQRTPGSVQLPHMTQSMRKPNMQIDNEIGSREIDPKKIKYAAVQSTTRCLAAKAGDSAASMVGGAMSDDPNFERLVKGLSDRKYSRCIHADAVGTPMDIINGALAEQLLTGKSPTLDERAKAVDVNKADQFSGIGKGLTVASLARCAAVYSPGMVMRVLGTQQGSVAEKQALEALFAKTPECGVAKVPDSVSTLEQRAALATGLYFWVQRG